MRSPRCANFWHGSIVSDDPGAPLFELDRAAELIELIPNGSLDAEAGAFILQAVEQPAPEAWLHVAIGLMMQADGMTVDGDGYRCAVADSTHRDPRVQLFGKGSTLNGPPERLNPERGRVRAIQRSFAPNALVSRRRKRSPLFDGQRSGSALRARRGTATTA